MNYVVSIVRLMPKPVGRKRKVRSSDSFVPNPDTIDAIEEGRAGGLPRFASVEALMEDLNSEDPH